MNHGAGPGTEAGGRANAAKPGFYDVVVGSMAPHGVPPLQRCLNRRQQCHRTLSKIVQTELDSMSAILSETPDSAQISRQSYRDPHRILYVEDDEVLRGSCAKLLARRGYRVDMAEDGHHGWEALQLARYDLLITDNHMPRLGGIELVKRLRSAGNRVPAVLASGSFIVEEVRRDRSLQLAATLKKPFTTEQLLETVEQVLTAASGVRTRGELSFPMLVETSAHLQPVRWWGINE